MQQLVEFLHVGVVEMQDITPALDVLLAADRYDIQDLKKRCIDYLALKVTKKTAEEVLTVAEQLDLSSLVETCEKLLCRKRVVPFKDDEPSTLRSGKNRRRDFLEGISFPACFPMCCFYRFCKQLEVNCVPLMIHKVLLPRAERKRKERDRDVFSRPPRAALFSFLSFPRSP